MRLNRRYLEFELECGRKETELSDEIAKLRIENEYHRATINQLHAEGYGLAQQGAHPEREQVER